MMNENSQRIYLMHLTNGKSVSKYIIAAAATEAEALSDAIAVASVQGRRDNIWQLKAVLWSWGAPMGEQGAAEHAKRCHEINRGARYARDFKTLAGALGECLTLGLRTS
jgi:hypothetical protein